MTRKLRESFRLSAFIGGELVDMAPPPAAEMLAMLRRGEVWGEACICPEAGEFPRANVSFHAGYGFVMQCYEGEQSWSDFLAVTDRIGRPEVEIELGGQALERWPRELFVPEELAAEALDWFLNSGEESRNLRWVRIDRFPREIVWEGRTGPEAREKRQDLREHGRDVAK